jgi:aspartokinase
MSTQRFAGAKEAYTLTVSSQMCLFCVERRGIGSGADLVGRILLCLCQNDVKLSMFSQASASGNFCFVISSAARELVLSVLSNELHDELQRREIVCLGVRDHVALLQVVPSSASAWLSERLAARGINILAVAQDSGSISLLIQQSDLPTAVASLNVPASAEGAGLLPSPRVR